MVDAVVIGARCAGASTALLLARRGLDVLLVDRAPLPERDPARALHPPPRPRAASATGGSSTAAPATGCPPVSARSRPTSATSRSSAGDLVVDGVPVGLGPRRAALDAVLVRRRPRRPARMLREGFPVDEPGLRRRAAPSACGAGRRTERARLVIGAAREGRSNVARWVEAPAYGDVPHSDRPAGTFSYWSGVRRRGARALPPRPPRDLRLSDQRQGSSPSSSPGRSTTLETRPRRLSSASCSRSSTAVPQLAERVRAGRREERLYGATALPNFLRRPLRPGLGLGRRRRRATRIRTARSASATRSGTRSSSPTPPPRRCSSGRPGGGRPSATVRAARTRNEATLPSTTTRTSTSPGSGRSPPQCIRLRAAIRGDEERTRAFYLASEGLAAVA